MSTKFITLAVAGLLGLAASADVLYWQVNNSSADANTKSEYAYAILRATTGSSATDGTQYYVSQNISSSGSTLNGAIERDVFANGSYVGGVMDAAKILSFTDGSTAYGTSGADLSSLSFFLELYDASGNWVGETSPVQAYNTLVNNGTISGFDASFKGVNAAMGSTGGYQPVPEPTSGLLMLVGLGALALRRRRA